MHITLPTGGILAFVNKISIMKNCVAMYCRVHTSCIKDIDAYLQDGGWSPWSSWSSCSPRQVTSINNHHSHIKAKQPSCPSAQVMSIPGCSYQSPPVHLVAPRCSYHYPQVHSPPPPYLHRPTSITWRFLLQRSRPGWRRNDLLSWF